MITDEDLKAIAAGDGIAEITITIRKNGTVRTISADTSTIRMEVEWKHEDGGSPDFFDYKSRYFRNPWLAPRDTLNWTIKGQMVIKAMTI